MKNGSKFRIFILIENIYIIMSNINVLIKSIYLEKGFGYINY